MTVDLGIDRRQLEATGTRMAAGETLTAAAAAYACGMFDPLRAAGFQIELHSHAQAVLSVDFADATNQLETILATATVPITLGPDIGTEAAFAVD